MSRKKKKKEPIYRKEKSRKIVQRRRNLFYKYRSSTRNDGGYSVAKKEKPLKILLAPSTFSIHANVSEALKFFEDLHSILQRNNRIYLDMSMITDISEDAILYLLSRLHFYFWKYPKYEIGGNFPVDKKCEKLLLDSQFTKYVQTARKWKEGQNEIFPIRDGILSDGKVVGDVLSFVSSKINLTDDNSFDIYGPMLECLTNSKNHAYKSPSPLYKKWWLIAIPDPKNRKVHYTTLDNGQGIPTTVKKKFLEKIRSMGRSNDADLIISALKGDFRTRTGIIERGKGLPSIFESTNNSQIDNLTIISNFGYVKINKSKIIAESRTLKKKFYGTLISWDFIE